jgi:hypothetical protein
MSSPWALPLLRIDQLGDIVFLELPDVGDIRGKGRKIRHRRIGERRWKTSSLPSTARSSSATIPWSTPPKIWGMIPTATAGSSRLSPKTWTTWMTPCQPRNTKNRLPPVREDCNFAPIVSEYECMLGADCPSRSHQRLPFNLELY